MQGRKIEKRDKSKLCASWPRCYTQYIRIITTTRTTYGIGLVTAALSLYQMKRPSVTLYVCVSVSVYLRLCPCMSVCTRRIIALTVAAHCNASRLTET